MSDKRSIYLTALSYELGDALDIIELDELKKKHDVLETLLKFGLQKYSKTKLTPSEMAKKSVQRTLETVGIRRESIDVLIYATTSFWNSEFYGHKEISRFIYELDLKNAYPIGVFFSQCGNSQVAIRTANSLIKAGDCKNVLVVATDKVEENKTRIVPPNISIASDAAASCIISNEVKGDFEVIQTSQYINAAMGHIDPNKQVKEYMMSFADGIKQTLWKAMTVTGKNPTDFRQLIVNNYNTSVSRNIGKLVGFKLEQIYIDNIAKFAHTPSADNFINLHDFSASNSIESGEAIILLGSGLNTWGATVLHKT